LNRYPSLKEVLYHKLKLFNNVEVKFTHGHPTCILYEQDRELERFEINDMNQEGLFQVLAEHGFTPAVTYHAYAETPNSVLEWGGHRYELYTEINPYAYASNFAASEERDGQKGHVLTITSDEELHAVGTWLKEAGAPRVLLAASDASNEGQWTWIEGPETHTAFWSGDHAGAPVNDEFSRWVKFEPNNANSKEHCAELFLLGEDGLPGFNDNECDTFSAWLVVEYGQDRPVPSEADVTAAEGRKLAAKKLEDKAEEERAGEANRKLTEELLTAADQAREAVEAVAQSTKDALPLKVDL